jgi:hypothetical protein
MNVKFISKYENLVLCVKPNRVQIQDGIAMQVPGEHIRFQGFEYETTDKSEIVFLKKHRLYSVDFTVAEEPKKHETGAGE